MFLGIEFLDDHHLAGIVEGLEHPYLAYAGALECACLLPEFGQQPVDVVDQEERGNQHSGCLLHLGVGVVEAAGDLTGEHGRDVLDAGGVEPVEEHPRTQQFDNGFPAVYTDHHQDAAGIP